MFTILRRLRFLVVLVAILSALGFAYRAYSQALPATGMAVGAASALEIARASWGSASLIIAGTSGVAATVAIAGGTFLGLTPIGWAGIGLAVAASIMLVGDTESPSGQTAVVVSGSSITNDPNPDLPSGGSQIVTISNPVLFQSVKAGGGVFSYLWFDKAACLSNMNSCNGAIPGSMSVNWQRFQTRLAEYLLATYGTNIQYAYLVGASNGGAECNTVTGSATYSGTGGVCVRIVAHPGGAGRITLAENYNWGQSGTSLHATFRTTTGTPEDCEDASSYYDYTLAACILRKPPQTTLDDGVCRVSFSSSGAPVFNPFDVDCARAKMKLKMTLNPGSATTPPSVSVTDPASGRQVITERPTSINQGGAPGSVTVRERIPNPQNNTTTERVTTTSPAPVTPQNPSAAPVSNGSNQQIYPGTGSNISPTPAGSVAVTNWPDSLNVTGTVTCTNCTTEMPEKFKIDGELPEGVSQELPSAPVFEEPLSSFLDPLRERFTSLTGFQFPAHSTRCPALSIDIAPAGVRMSASSSFMCELLADNQTLIQGLTMFGYVATAIVIILGA